MKKLIGLITVIFTLSIITPTFAFSEEQSKAKKFWLQTKQSVKEAGQEIKEGTKKAGKEIKEGSKDAQLDKKLYWLRQILDWQSETRDSHEFIDSLKTDLFSEEVFLFTPKGDIITMQRGATPLDFAYRIHSRLLRVRHVGFGHQRRI